MAVYFDGSLYIEIAKSFPLPFAPEVKLTEVSAPLHCSPVKEVAAASRSASVSDGSSKGMASPVRLNAQTRLGRDPL